MTPRRNANGRSDARTGIAGCRAAPALAVLAALLAAAPARAAASGKQAPLACPAFTQTEAEEPPLPHLTASLQPGGTLNILVAGTTTPALPDAAAPPRLAGIPA